MTLRLPFRPQPTAHNDAVDFELVAYKFIWSEMGVLTLLWGSLTLRFPNLWFVWLTFYLPTLLASMAALWLNRRHETRGAVMVLIASGWNVLTLLAILYWREIPPDTNRYLIIVAIAALMLGKREGIVSALLCGVSEIFLAFYMLAQSAPGSHAVIATLLPHLFFLYLATLIPIIATRRVRMALKIAEEERDELRLADEINAENEARFISFVDNSTDVIIIHRKGELVHLNPASLKFLKADSPGRLLGTQILDLVRTECGEFPDVVAGRPFSQPHSAPTCEGRVVRMDGSAAVVEITTVPVSFKGEPALQTVLRDITELKRLQAQTRLQVAALNSAANGIVITDRSGAIIWINAAFESLTGYGLFEAFGKNLRELVKSGKQSTAFYREMWNTILSGKVWHGELVNRRKDGSLYTESMTITPVSGDSGEITHFVAVKQDITSKILMEAQLLKSQQLEGIGQLAGGLAHDYNNILNVIVGYSELLKRRLLENDPMRRPLEAINSSAKRGAELTRQLLAFAREGIISPEVIDVNLAVDLVKNMVERIAGSNVRLVFKLEEPAWSVYIDRAQFDQLLVNLVTNSRDAIRDSGSIVVSTRNITLQEGSTIPSGLESGEYVSITVEDDGIGMDEQTLNRIFEPFFTTKPKGHGAGLGLSTVYGIVKQCGGTVEVRSQKGKGTRATVYLPRFSEKDASPVMPAFDDRLRGNEAILIAEDRPDVLNLRKALLEKHGYQVLSAPTASEAEGISESFAGNISVLLTKPNMPDMSGKELIERIASRRPDIKSILLSDTPPEAASDPSRRDRDDSAGQPFDGSEITGRLVRILSSDKFSRAR